MGKPDAPCRDCDRRTMTCHIVCRDYKQYLKDNEEFNTIRKAEIERGKPPPSCFRAMDKAIKRKRRIK